MNGDSKSIMHVQNHIKNRIGLSIAALAFVLAGGLPNKIRADELKEAKVTQVIQDVRVLPSNASPRPAAVNDDVRQGTAVQTGVQSRSELTFKDQTITRLGEQTIFSVGKGPRSIDLGSGQFLLYAPKKAGGAKVKMGSVTAAITG
jgi:hypothetical protein